jgi:hypothetical protein
MRAGKSLVRVGEACVRYTERLGCLGVVVATLALAGCGAKDSQNKKPDATAQANAVRALERKLATIAGQANQAAPADIDPDTRLDGVKAGPGLRLTSTYTLVNSEASGVTNETFESKLGPVVRKGSCENPDLRPLINQGVVVVLEYRGGKGDPIGTINIDRNTCVALK